MTVRTTPVADVPPDADLLLPHEAAALLRLDAKTLGRWHRAGLIPAVVLPSGHRRFWRSDVERIRRGGGNPRTAQLPQVDGQLVLPLAGLLDEALQAKAQEAAEESQA
jgi:hypothetical protein